MAEWSIASDLKSDELTGSVSSNLTLSFRGSIQLRGLQKVFLENKPSFYPTLPGIYMLKLKKSKIASSDVQFSS